MPSKMVTTFVDCGEMERSNWRGIVSAPAQADSNFNQLASSETMLPSSMSPFRNRMRAGKLPLVGGEVTLPRSMADTLSTANFISPRPSARVQPTAPASKEAILPRKISPLSSVSVCGSTTGSAADATVCRQSNSSRAKARPNLDLPGMARELFIDPVGVFAQQAALFEGLGPV